MSTEQIIFLIMVFVAVFLLALSLFVPTLGADAHAGRRMRGRIKGLIEELDANTASLLRERYLRDLSPLERNIERFPGMEKLEILIEQAGWKIPAYRLVLISLMIAGACFLVMLLLIQQPLYAVIAGSAGFTLPYMKLSMQRNQRLAQFDEQFPEALDIISRALRAGYPFNEALKLISEEMYDPIACEFNSVYSDISYGVSTKGALYGLLQRVPSVTLLTMVTAVIVQRETGGNLAEILDKIAAVVRGRFRFQRRVRTLTAEGRMSAWVLTLLPFVLTAMLSITSPEYIPLLVKDPQGQKLILAAFVLVTLGTLWIRRIIRLQV